MPESEAKSPPSNSFINTPEANKAIPSVDFSQNKFGFRKAGLGLLVILIFLGLVVLAYYFGPFKIPNSSLGIAGRLIESEDINPISAFNAGCPFSEVFYNLEEASRNPSKVCALNLDSAQPVTVPADISKFNNLKALSLRNNNIVELPETVGQLSNLEILVLTNNSLNAVPTGVIPLKKLRTLVLNGNQISELPKEISQLPALNYLSVSVII